MESAALFAGRGGGGRQEPGAPNPRVGEAEQDGETRGLNKGIRKDDEGTER